MTDVTNIFKPWCRMAAYGHSFVALSTQQSASGAGLITIVGPRGAFFWPQLLLGPKFDAPHMTYGRHGGQNTGTFALDANINNFLTEAVAKKINTVYFCGLCNDGLSNLTASSTTITNVTKLVRAWTGAGLRVILTGDMPAGLAFLRSNPGNLQGFMRVRNYMLNVLPDMFPGVAAIDTFGQCCAYNSTDGSPLPGYTDTDGLHPTVIGHYTMLSAAAHQIDKWFPGQRNFATFNNSEDYHATMNKSGNVLVNGMLTGNASGVASSWVSSAAPAGMSVAASKVPGYNKEQQQFVYSGTPSGAAATHAFRQDFSTAKINSGDVVRASCIIEVEGNRKNFRGIEVQLSLSDAAGGYTGQCGYSPTLGDVWPADDFTGASSLFFLTPESAIAGAWTSGMFGRFSVNVIFDAASQASSATVRISNCKIFKTAATTGF